MKARRSASSRQQHTSVPESVWLAVYACGAFRCSRDAGGALQAGRAGQDTCCARGGHAFKVVEYACRPETAIAKDAERRAEPLRLPVLMRRLRQRVSDCSRCGLSKTRTHTVFARGNPEAPVCFVGEAPGAEEDAQGKPFVGRAGKLLDEMIEQMGLSPEKDVYICNIIKCRPPGNRRPEPEESATCIPYLHEQLALVRPRVIVALGNTSVAALLDSKLGITKVRGQWKLYRGQTLVMPTYHPSYLLRPSPQQAEAKRQVWQDLQLVMKELGLEIRPLPRRPQPG